jgi:diguanylate cyclase
MIESKEWLSIVARARYAGYDMITGSISWLLIALVFLDVTLIPIDRHSTLLLVLLCFTLLSYNLAARHLALFRNDVQLRATLNLMALFFFVVAVCWCTGKLASPFLSFIYLILMATSLTLGRRVSYLMAALAVICYTLLAAAQMTLFGGHLAGRIIELFPFPLIAYLGARLTGEAESARLEVERLSLTDDLTELNNMRSFEALAQHQERLAARYQKSFAICMIDSDDLKQVNDRFGHLAGTELIKWTAQIIRKNTRDCDIAARFGGDEFIIMYNDHDKERILPAVQRIVRAMAANPFYFEGEMIHATLSAGVASFPEDGSDLREVIKRADEAMYLSKRLGKNRATLSGDEARGGGQVARGKERITTGKERTALPRRPVSSPEGCDRPFRQA